MVKVKICGITTEEDVSYLNESDVDYAGFVQFYGKSKRNLTTEQAIRLMKGLKPSIQKVAVVVKPDREQMQILAQAGFDYIQIHGEISDELLDESLLPVWKAFNVSDLSEWERYEKHEKVKGFVFDAQVPGSGKVFDWKLLMDLPETEKFVMLAGGLCPENVGEAIHFVQPDGVDTSSGVEKDSGEGKKMEKIQAFVKAVKGGKK